MTELYSTEEYQALDIQAILGSISSLWIFIGFSKNKNNEKCIFMTGSEILQNAALIWLFIESFTFPLYYLNFVILHEPPPKAAVAAEGASRSTGWFHVSSCSSLIKDSLRVKETSFIPLSEEWFWPAYSLEFSLRFQCANHRLQLSCTVLVAVHLACVASSPEFFFVSIYL